MSRTRTAGTTISDIASTAHQVTSAEARAGGSNQVRLRYTSIAAAPVPAKSVAAKPGAKKAPAKKGGK